MVCSCFFNCLSYSVYSTFFPLVLSPLTPASTFASTTFFPLLAIDDVSSPKNTRVTATHCCGSRGLPLHSTLSRMLKNLRVVQISVFTSDPNFLIVPKMNSCPTAPHRQNSRMYNPACKCKIP